MPRTPPGRENLRRGIQKVTAERGRRRGTRMLRLTSLCRCLQPPCAGDRFIPALRIPPPWERSSARNGLPAPPSELPRCSGGETSLHGQRDRSALSPSLFPAPPSPSRQRRLAAGGPRDGLRRVPDLPARQTRLVPLPIPVPGNRPLICSSHSEAARGERGEIHDHLGRP